MNKPIIKFNVFLLIFCFLCGCEKQNTATLNSQHNGSAITATNNVSNESREAQLFEAINQWDETKVKELIARGVNINACSKECIYNRDNDEMSAATAAGKMLFVGDLGTETWHPALDIKNNPSAKNILIYIIEAGASLDGCSWLIKKIVESGDIRLVKLLIEKGVELKKYKEILHDAAISGNEEVFKLIFSLKPEANYNKVLVWAVSGGYHHSVPRNEIIVKFLIEHGADVNYCTEDGCPVLICAARSTESIIKLFLQNKVNLNCKLKDTDFLFGGGNALMFAALEGGNENIINLLIESGINLEEKDASGQTALFWAAGSKAIGWRDNADESLVSFLLGKGANPKVTDKEGKSYLDYLAEF